MAGGKWITGLEPGMPVAAAARRVLAARLEVVRRALPLALRPAASEDPEYIHQLRVGTRRAEAALRIFRGCLRRRAYRSARARLRAIRRSAGAVRDWDVFLQAVRHRAASAALEELPGFDFLVGYAVGQRNAAAAALEAVELGQPGTFARFAEETLREVRPPGEEDGTLGDLARDVLPRLLRRLEKAGAGDLDDHARLHQLRIRGKRLRYALEVLAGCFGGRLREEVYPLVEKMQDVLGAANDSHVAAGRLAGLCEQLRSREAIRERVGPGVEALLRHHQQRLPQQRERFAQLRERWRQMDVGAVLAMPADGALPPGGG